MEVSSVKKIIVGIDVNPFINTANVCDSYRILSKFNSDINGFCSIVPFRERQNKDIIDINESTTYSTTSSSLTLGNVHLRRFQGNLTPNVHTTEIHGVASFDVRLV